MVQVVATVGVATELTSVVVAEIELLSVDSLVVSKDEEVPEQVKIEHLVLV